MDNAKQTENLRQWHVCDANLAAAGWNDEFSRQRECDYRRELYQNPIPPI